jgi:hypothetical protein
LKRLTSWPGVDGVVLDFGIERRDVVVQCDVLPPDLLRVVGELGRAIELSQYPVGDSHQDIPPGAAAQSG